MANAAANDVTEWTVMGYLAGDNNLNEEMVLTLQEIVASRKLFNEPLWPRVKIYAQLDPSGLGLPTQRYAFDTTNARVNSENEHRLETYEVAPYPNPQDYSAEVNTGNPAALSGFVEWAANGRSSDPDAEHHLLLLSGHGSGTTEDFLLRDDAPADSLTIPELEEALVKAREYIFGNAGKKKIDLLGMDCCFMSMVEVFYQIRNHVDIVVAAESMIPDFGWPYHRILAAAMKERKNTEKIVKPPRLAEIIVDQFIEYYSDYDSTAGRSVDLAWVKLSEMDALKDSISNLGLALKKALLADPKEDPKFRDQIVLAHWEAQTYKFDQFVDIRDFCEIIIKRFGRLESSEEKDGVDRACKNVIEKLDRCIGRSGCSGFAYQHSYGLSMYFPWAAVFENYRYNKAPGKGKSFEWAKDNKWLEFLDEYVVKSRRDPRKDMRDSEKVDGPHEKAINHALDALIRSANLGDAAKPRRLARGFLKMMARVLGAADPGDLPEGSRYHKSRYHKSRYHKSRYHKSRWPGDREKSVKNFTPVVGTAYWPPRSEGPQT